MQIRYSSEMFELCRSEKAGIVGIESAQPGMFAMRQQRACAAWSAPARRGLIRTAGSCSEPVCRVSAAHSPMHDIQNECMDAGHRMCVQQIRFAQMAQETMKLNPSTVNLPEPRPSCDCLARRANSLTIWCSISLSSMSCSLPSKKAYIYNSTMQLVADHTCGKGH